MNLCVKFHPDEECLVVKMSSKESGVSQKVDGVEIGWSSEYGSREFGQAEPGSSSSRIPHGVEYLTK
ncbi:hypothetical protein GCM10010361_64090 [Streptomyces olivaceiscleroticus]|uniref:DUF397 domain-containing protein n=1 Tax=Streptomyces olivaceiscleroticus TaxID=68245 RepID=A0ABN1B4D5_9ACTN